MFDYLFALRQSVILKEHQEEMAATYDSRVSTFKNIT